MAPLRDKQIRLITLGLWRKGVFRLTRRPTREAAYNHTELDVTHQPPPLTHDTEPFRRTRHSELSTYLPLREGNTQKHEGRAKKNQKNQTRLPKTILDLLPKTHGYYQI